MDLANQIERILKAPFQSVVPTQPQVGQWVFPIISTSDERETFNDKEGNEVTQNRPFEDLGAQQGGHRKCGIVISANQINKLQDSIYRQRIS